MAVARGGELAWWRSVLPQHTTVAFPFTVEQVVGMGRAVGQARHARARTRRLWRHQDLVLSVAVTRARAGAGVLAVLHDLNLAAAHADRVAVVAGGRLRACGSPTEVLTSELLTGVYRREVEVLAHPRTGTPLVLPVR